MPEGPSIVILREELAPYRGKKVLEVGGNTSIDLSGIKGKKIVDFKSWGKHFLICFKNFFLRIHMLMWGSYRLNERKETAPRLTLTLKEGEINFYSCSVRRVEEDVYEAYNWESDVMSDEWNPAKAEKAVKNSGSALACDVLLDQQIFSGVGNIIKNEVLFRVKVDPGSIASTIPAKKLKELVKEARDYSFDFYRWKKIYQLKKHFLIYKKKTCPRCDLPVTRTWMGKTDRLTCFCTNCQELYSKKPKKLKK